MYLASIKSNKGRKFTIIADTRPEILLSVREWLLGSFITADREAVTDLVIGKLAHGGDKVDAEKARSIAIAVQTIWHGSAHDFDDRSEMIYEQWFDEEVTIEIRQSGSVRYRDVLKPR